MSLPNRQAWSIAAPHAPDCWCQFCFFHRLERVEAETELALRRAQYARRLGPDTTPGETVIARRVR